MGLLSREQHADTGSLSQSQCACGRSLDPVVSDEGNVAGHSYGVGVTLKSNK